MNEGMLVAMRQIIEHFVLVGGMLKVEIIKELLSSASKGQETTQRKRKMKWII